jgi:hypothetical protein
MWQSIVVVVIVAGVLIYTVRHFLRAVRSGEAGCSSCACCPAGSCPEAGVADSERRDGLGSPSSDFRPPSSVREVK